MSVYFQLLQDLNFFILSFLIVSLILIVIVVIISYLAMKRLVVPNEHTRSGGHRAGLLKEIKPKILARPDLREVEFKNDEGQILKGFFFKRPNPKGNLLLCHGIHSIKEFFYLFLEMFPDYNILMFDFRAHGQSEGDLITIGFKESNDVINASIFLKNKTKNDGELPLIIFGASMGGAASLKATEINPNICDALIIDSSFKSLREIVYESFHVRSKGLPRFPFFYVTKWVFYFVSKINFDKMLPIESVKKINKPIFFIHSSNDNIVPSKNSVEMFAVTTHEKSRLWVGPECQHARLHNVYLDLYRKKVNKFLKNIFN
ncbi:MAG: alpha/beta hydrolase [bacterium]